MLGYLFGMGRARRYKCCLDLFLLLDIFSKFMRSLDHESYEISFCSALGHYEDGCPEDIIASSVFENILW